MTYPSGKHPNEVWKDGTSSHKRGIQKEFDFNACAQRVLTRGYMCTPCHMQEQCNIKKLFTPREINPQGVTKRN